MGTDGEEVRDDMKPGDGPSSSPERKRNAIKHFQCLLESPLCRRHAKGLADHAV